MRPLIMSVFLWLMCVSDLYACVYMDIQGVCVCLVCEPAENTSAASLLVRPGDTGVHLPHLSSAVEYIFL